MPLVFSPPPRLTHDPDEFSTGSAQEQRPACHSRSPNAPRLPRAAPRIGAAVSAAVLLLSACTAGPEEHTLATPTTATPTNTAEAVPEYTTDLQLSEEEKKAVDEAISVLTEFVDLYNQVFKASGSKSEEFERVARDEVLFKSENEAKQFANQKIRLEGTYRLDRLGVHAVDLEIDDDTQIPFVTVHACVPTNEYRFSGGANTEPLSDKEAFSTFEYVIANYDESWFVSEQYLWADECAL